VASGGFRQDLFYRLAVIRIDVPPLRARREDVPALVAHFLASHAQAGGPLPAVSAEAMRLLEAYDWPGNVRELRNAVEHAVVVSGGGPVLPAHLPEGVRRGPAPAPAGDSAAAILDRYVERLADEGPEAFRTAMADLEKRLIARALAETGGNQSAAAERLGIHRNTLRTKIREYGLDV
jgi:DNA-binding NtrC family response regulator